MRCRQSWLGLMMAVMCGVSGTVTAEELGPEEMNESVGAGQTTKEIGEEEGGLDGFHLLSALSIRPYPIGLSWRTQAGYKRGLFESDSILLNNTFVDAGVSTALSPASFWVGPYLEILPLAVLNLRVTAQFLRYFGNFGFLYVPAGGEQDWSLDALDTSAEQGLGQSTTGLLVEAQATPQMRVGRVVVQAQTTFGWMQMDVEDQYYEPFYDLFFAPTDTFWVTRPTVGYLLGRDLSKGYLLLGARWEHVSIANSRTSRDTVGMLFNWKVPASVMEWGDPALSGFGGVHVDHPNRGRVSPYLGIQALVQFQ